MNKILKKVLIFVVLLATMCLFTGCFITFEGPEGWSQEDNMNDAQFDFNHLGTKE